jgi:hypothetical protein
MSETVEKPTRIFLFDETEDQRYASGLSFSLREVGHVVMPFSDIEVALNELNTQADAVICTARPNMAPDDTRPSFSTLPVIQKANDLDRPLGLWTQVPELAKAFLKPGSADKTFDISHLSAEDLNIEISSWLKLLESGKLTTVPTPQTDELSKIRKHRFQISGEANWPTIVSGPDKCLGQKRHP